MNISFQFFYIIFINFSNTYIRDKKDFENFLVLSVIVSFALTLLSRGSSSWSRSRTWTGLYSILIKLSTRGKREH